MKILVIGGSGFIGSRLCARLEQSGARFLIFDKAKSPFFSDERCVIGDIRDSAALEKSLDGIDVVVNLAAEHRDDVRPVSLYDEVNVQGARNLVEACRRKNVRTIVFTSSVAVYGFAKPEEDETGPIRYFNDYGRTKWGAEEVYRAWYDENPDARSLIILRPTVVFGERNRGNVYNLIKQIASRFFFMVGNGNNIKSMAYVENVAAFLEYCTTSLKGFHVYNYIDKPDFSMNKLVELVNKELGKEDHAKLRVPYWLAYVGGLVFDLAAFVSRKKLTISSIRVKKFCATTHFSSNNIGKTGFLAPVSLTEGLRRTIRYEFLEHHDKDSVLFYSE